MNQNSTFQSGEIVHATGAAYGIGKAACEHFQRHGMAVCMVDLNMDNLPRSAVDVSAGIQIRRLELGERIYACCHSYF